MEFRGADHLFLVRVAQRASDTPGSRKLILPIVISVAAAQASVATPPAVHLLRWEGTAEVYPPGQVIKLGVRTKIEDGNVLSETWPVDQGEAKGMHRMTLDATGGTTEIGGKKGPMPQAMWDEEHAQYGFYAQLQEASLRAWSLARQGVTGFSVDGAVKTWFRIDSAGNIIGAVNDVPSGENGARAYQTFRFDGFWQSNGRVFPRHMEMFRQDKPYFTLDVTKFEGQ